MEAFASWGMAERATMIMTMATGVRGAAHLLVLIPALDEASTVGDVIRAIPTSLDGIGSVRIVVIDDGSTDDTPTVAEAAGAHVIRRQRTGGVGAAFHTGVSYAIEQGSDLVVSLDADGQFDPRTIPDLIAPVLAGECDFATASRFKDPALVPDMPLAKRLGNRFMSHLISRLAGQKLHDVSCGMRCYNREAILRLHLLARFTYTQEVILNLAFKELRIAEVPIPVRGVRRHGKSRVASNLWRYGVKTLRIILRSYRDYRPLQFLLGAAGLFFLVASGLAVFLGMHYLETGSFSPHKWAGVSAGLLVALAFSMAHMGIVGDMLNRHRSYLEEILYRQRKTLEGERKRGVSPGEGDA